MLEMSDLEKNRAVEAHLEWQLRQVRRRIHVLEQQEAEQRRRDEEARAAAGWLIQPKGATGSVDHAILHRGDCPLGAKATAIPRRQAELALGEPYVRCCEVCCPEKALGAGE